MKIDRLLNCKDCKYHEKEGCKRIKYNSSYQSIDKIEFHRSCFSCQPSGKICNDFEIRDYYLNSPDFKDFTLDKYIIYKGIEQYETYMTKLPNLIREGSLFYRINHNYRFEHSQVFHYRILKDGKELKRYKNYQSWANGEGILDDWVDICRTLPYDEEKIREFFLQGEIGFRTIPNNKIVYYMNYKDFFYNKMYIDGKFNAVRKRTFKRSGFFDEKIDGVYLTK